MRRDTNSGSRRGSSARRARLGGALVYLCLLVWMTAAAATAQGPDELLFLVDNQLAYDEESRLYRVDLDEGTQQADLTLVPNGILPYDQCHLACSPDGASCFLVNRFDVGPYPDGGQLIHYDIASGTVTEIGLLVDPDEPAPVDPVDFRIPNAQQASFDLAGTLYVASAATDKLYTVDAATGVASCVGRPIREAPDGSLTPVNIGGGDLAFTSDGRLFLWTNQRRDPGPVGEAGGLAARGLYELFLPEDFDCADDLAPSHRVSAEFLLDHEGEIGSPADRFYGIAIRNAGLGAIVMGSAQLPVSSEMHIHDRDGAPTPGLAGHLFNVHLGGLPFSVGTGGDLSTGFLEAPGACPTRIREVRFEYTGDSCSSPNASNNNQAGYSCRRDLDGEEPVKISVRRKPGRTVIDPDTETVNIGSWISMGSSDSRRLFPNLLVEISQGGSVLQLIDIHVSCSQPLAVGDQFGSLVLRQIIGD